MTRGDTITTKTKTVKLDGVTASNLSEIARHLRDLSDGEIEKPRTAAINSFIDSYVSDYAEQFDGKGNGQYVYVGGDSQ